VVKVRETATLPPPRSGSFRDIGKGQPTRCVLPVGSELIHVSTWGELAAFAPVVTCFSSEPVLVGSVYRFTVTAPVVGYVYGDGETRVDLGEYGDCFLIEYIGEYRGGSSILVDSVGRVVDRFKVFSPVDERYGEYRRWDEAPHIWGDGVRVVDEG